MYICNNICIWCNNIYIYYIHISVISIFLRPEVGPTTSSYPEKGMREELDLQSPAMPGASIMGPTEVPKPTFRQPGGFAYSVQKAPFFFSSSKPPKKHMKQQGSRVMWGSMICTFIWFAHVVTLVGSRFAFLGEIWVLQHTGWKKLQENGPIAEKQCLNARHCRMCMPTSSSPTMLLAVGAKGVSEAMVVEWFLNIWGHCEGHVQKKHLAS